MTVEMFRAEDYPSDDDGLDSTHAALFAHVGVTDPADWRAVALALAQRYAPQVLPRAATAPTGKKAGRPITRDELTEVMIFQAVEEIRSDWREGRIKTNVSTIAALCEFYINNKEADPYRQKFKMYVPTDVKPERLANLVTQARKSEKAFRAKSTENTGE